MPDVRAKLAEALRDQHAMAYDDDAAMYYCDCGMATGDYRVWADHMVDVLLSLEGVAIVALPEPDGQFSSWQVFCDDEPESVYAIPKERTVCISGVTSFSSAEARCVAVALLAAADAAEAATDA